MLDQSPHPRDGESRAPQLSGRPSDSLPHSLCNEAGNLPSSSFSSSNIETAKKVLMSERFGISYRDVLAQLSRAPWTFPTTVDFNSTALTTKLLDFNSELARGYQERLQSEGALSRLLASVALVGRPLPSAQFLKSMREVNRIVQDLSEAGLLKIEDISPDKVITGDRLNPIHIGSRSYRISATDLGNIVLYI